MNFCGDYPEDFATVAIYFTTHDVAGAPVAPLTAYEAADVTIYKNGSATQKTSTNGVTMTSPFDSIVGLHCVVIDTSNDTGDSGFWTTGGGGVYSVVLIPDTETVNGQTTVKVIGTFGIALSPKLTAAQIATGVWTDTTAGDFTTALSVGKSVMNGVSLGTGLTVATVTNQLTAAAIATGVWTDTTAGDFTTALSVGKSVMNGVSLGTGLTVNDITTKTGFSLSSSQTFNVTGNITGNLTGSVGSVTGAVGSVTGLTASNLDTTISSRMATYTQPTGFLAATFPSGTIANTTNITSITGNITGNLSGSVGSVTTVNDKTGYALTSGERISIANEVEAQIIDDTDSEKVLTAITDKIASVNPDLSGLTLSAIASSVWSSGTRVLTAGTNIQLPSNGLANVTAWTVNITGDVSGSIGSVTGLTFTVPNVADVNIRYVNSVLVNGDGSATPWGP